MPSIKQEERIKPQWFVVKAVALIILGGALLLMLPWAARRECRTDPGTAVFMATSAVCVTGHSLVNVHRHFSIFGQMVILALVQAGGLGFMMMGTFLLGLAGRRMSMQNEQALLDVLRMDESRNLKSLLRRAVAFSFLLELCGAVILAWRFYTVYGQTPARACYNGVFHAVSAYCNAGFTLFTDSLTGFRQDPVIMGVMAALIVAGGIGFMVIYDLSRYKFWSRNRLRRGHLMLHTKIVLLCAMALLLVGGAGFAVLEWNITLAPLSWRDKAVAAFFHSVSARTAGFNLVDMAAARPATRFLNLALMFIGGAPGSAAGGIKTTTAVVLLAATISMIKGRRETVLLDRTLSIRNIEEALSIFLLGILIVAGIFGLLLITEHAKLAAGAFSTDFLLFDTVSAFGTVGLSTGVMPALSPAGKIIMTVCMFIGRVGPLTIAMLVGVKTARHLVRHPEEDVLVG